VSYEGVRNHLQIIENKPCDEQRCSSAEKFKIAKQTYNAEKENNNKK
jgi:hypothetical protein